MFAGCKELWYDEGRITTGIWGFGKSWWINFMGNRNFKVDGGIMGRKKYWILRLFFVLFTMSVSVAVLPCGTINVHGLFGEVTTHVIVEDKEQEIISIKDVGYKKSKL